MTAANMANLVRLTAIINKRKISGWEMYWFAIEWYADTEICNGTGIDVGYS